MKLLKKILRPWFLAFLLVFTIHQIMQKGCSLRVPLLDNYLDPLLLMPMLLHLYLWEKRLLSGKPLSYVLPTAVAFSCFLFIAFIAEGVFPLLDDSFIADWLDVLCYFAGSLLFLTILNRRASSPD